MMYSVRALRRELAHVFTVRRLFALALVAGTTAPAAAQGAAVPRADVSFACGDCRRPRLTLADTGARNRPRSDTTQAGAPTRTPRSSSRLPYVFFGVMTAGVVANTFVGADRDPGGYEDTWASEASFPDKVVHGLTAFALTSVGVDLKVRPIFAAITTCAAGAIFETTQGYISSYDIAADCAGAAVAGMWRHWRASR